jgi:hypothetical protein
LPVGWDNCGIFCLTPSEAACKMFTERTLRNSVGNERWPNEAKEGEKRDRVRDGISGVSMRVIVIVFASLFVLFGSTGLVSFSSSCWRSEILCFRGTNMSRVETATRPVYRAGLVPPGLLPAGFGEASPTLQCRSLRETVSGCGRTSASSVEPRPRPAAALWGPSVPNKTPTSKVRECGFDPRFWASIRDQFG